MANTIGYQADGLGGQGIIRPADNTFISLYDFEQNPQVWDKWTQRYGNLIGILDTMRLMGAVDRFKLKNDKITMFEDTNIERPLRLEVAIPTTGASTEFNVEVDHDDYDDNGNTILQAGQTFYIPGKYITDTENSTKTTAQAFVKSVTNAGTNAEVFVCEFFNNTTAITTEVPVTESLILGGVVAARGTGQPNGINRGSLAYELHTTLMKRSHAIEGGVPGTETYRDLIAGGYQVNETMSSKGLSGIWYKGLEEMEFQFESDKDKQILMGEYNSNAIVQTAKLGGSNVVKSGDGILPILDDRGQLVLYDTEYGMNQYDELGRIMETQGVVTGDVVMMAGNEFGRTTENSSIDWVKSYSAGTDFSNGNYGSLETRFKMWDKGGLKFHLRTIPSFSNPFTYANDSTFANMAIAVPVSNNIKTSIDGENLSLNNIELSHFNNNGENRTNVIGDVFGMNGVGMPIFDEYDRGARYMFSEFMLTAAAVNQMVLIKKRDY